MKRHFTKEQNTTIHDRTEHFNFSQSRKVHRTMQFSLIKNRTLNLKTLQNKAHGLVPCEGLKVFQTSAQDILINHNLN